MGVDRKDIRREEEMDRKVSVSKDVRRIANGDVAGTLRDDIEELKSDFKSADDKAERALGGDDERVDLDSDSPRRSTRPGYGENRRS